MAKILIPADTKRIPVKDASGVSIGYIETPLIAANAIKYCQKCVEYEDQECTHVNTINNLEKDVKESTRRMKSMREDCLFEVNFWRQKYIEVLLFANVSKLNRCQKCLGRPYLAVTLHCGHLICDDCIQEYLLSFDYLLDPDISQVACPLPHPNSHVGDSSDPEPRYFCDFKGGALEIEVSRRTTTHSVKAIEAAIEYEVEWEDGIDETSWGLTERPNLRRFYSLVNKLC